MKPFPIARPCGIVLAGLLAMVSHAQATSVYRSLDAQGHATFSDRPENGGQRIVLDSLTVIPPLRRPEADSPDSSAPVVESAQPFHPYTTFHIVSPRHDMTLPSGHAGRLLVQLAVDPALHDGHRVRLLVDGRDSRKAMQEGAFMLDDLERGERVLQAELLDDQEMVRQRSAPVVFHVRRASVYLPQNPNNPG